MNATPPLRAWYAPGETILADGVGSVLASGIVAAGKLVCFYCGGCYGKSGASVQCVKVKHKGKCTMLLMHSSEHALT